MSKTFIDDYYDTFEEKRICLLCGVDGIGDYKIIIIPGGTMLFVSDDVEFGPDSAIIGRICPACAEKRGKKVEGHEVRN